MRLIRWIKWKIKGKPYIQYSGFRCGCCGKWVEEQLNVPDYKSYGKWGDGWGFATNVRKERNMPYMIKCWIPTEAEDPQIYYSMYNAKGDLLQVENMQPENKYEIVECNKYGKEVAG